LKAQWEDISLNIHNDLSGVAFINEKIGFVVGGLNIYKTDDGGEIWKRQTIRSESVFYEDVTIYDEFFVAAIGREVQSNKSVITISQNQGLTWNTYQTGTFGTLTAVDFINREMGYCAGFNGVVIKTEDSGRNWQPIEIGRRFQFFSIHFINEKVGIIVGSKDLMESSIFKTTDAGETWLEIENPGTDPLQSVYFVDDQMGYAVGWNGQIMKTLDCGSTWDVQTSVTMHGNLDVFFTDSLTGYVVGGQTSEAIIQKTIDGGMTWKNIGPDKNSGLISVSFPSFNVGYAVGSNGTILKTTSAGETVSTTKVLPAEFDVYPNPTNDILLIESKDHYPIEEVILYQSDGQEVIRKKVTSSMVQLDCSHLSAGNHYLLIRSKDDHYMRRITKVKR